MRARTLVTSVICWLAVTGFSAPTGAHVADSPALKALTFFAALPAPDTGSLLRTLRPPRISAEARARALAVLPELGELQPDRAERAKLATLNDVLIYHERDQVFEVKLIDVPQAAVALHQRAVLLISRPALSLLSDLELRALVAHEIGHDYFWREFEETHAHGDRLGRQELELKCDGIAVLTLLALGLDPAPLLEGLGKLTRFNEMLGATANARDYPQLQERRRFMNALRALARP